MTKNTLIIVPTFNEAGNIQALYDGITKYAPLSDILFVDDGSKDGTLKLIDSLMRCDQRVNIIKRASKQGLANAYIAGWKWGLERGYDWFQQMDADLSHDPKILPVIEEKKKNFDLIIASRYISGGGADKWAAGRKVLSSGGGLYLNLVLTSSIRDLTGGYNCWHLRVIKNMDLDGLISHGFIFQAEMKYAAYMKGFKIIEVPFCFKEREQGISKMSSAIVLEGLLKPLLIKLKYRNEERYKC